MSDLMLHGIFNMPLPDDPAYARIRQRDTVLRLISEAPMGEKE